MPAERPLAREAVRTLRSTGAPARPALPAAASESGQEHGRLIIVSNRLPYRIEADGEGGYAFTRSTGGLATGLGPLHERMGNQWIGWADVGEQALAHAGRTVMEAELARLACTPVYLSDHDATLFYEGFSNSTLWPLFHGFPQHTRFQQDAWEAYERVNRQFCEAVLHEARPGDTVWVQDYHLMLLPALLRDALPDVRIGFFLHIPFPDFETFRMLPWRAELMHGVLGADLIGFHAYDYVRHFLSSCRRIAGTENRNGLMGVDGRLVQADAFPLGIDYDRFRCAATAPQAVEDRRAFSEQPGRAGCKVMLSVERLDYSKGIPERLQAFDAFLERFPEWRERVVLVLVTVPSREGVDSYQSLKTQIDGLVGLINGKYATLGWSPVEYYYRSLPFERLVTLYAASDVMLVTPLRDGMNLVSKEYLACHHDRSGVLVLSEMAGAAYELHEALCVNPYDQEGLVAAMERALTMPEAEQRRRNAPMQQRLARYTSEKWAQEFLGSLDEVRAQQRDMRARRLGASGQRRMAEAFAHAQRRAVLVDYDGTLVPFAAEPEGAVPDTALLDLLGTLAADEHTTLAVLSGRDRATLGQWLGATGATLVAEHGVWLHDPHEGEGAWQLLAPVKASWKDAVRSALAGFVDRTPGSLLEEKDYSLVWHYRMCSQELAERRAMEVKDALGSNLADRGLALLEGNKVIEVHPRDIDKGQAARRWFDDPSYDFILVIGDDRTDEDAFRAAPEGAWTVKVGSSPTCARYALESPADVRALLADLADHAHLYETPRPSASASSPKRPSTPSLAVSGL